MHLRLPQRDALAPELAVDILPVRQRVARPTHGGGENRICSNSLPVKAFGNGHLSPGTWNPDDVSPRCRAANPMWPAHLSALARSTCRRTALTPSQELLAARTCVMTWSLSLHYGHDALER